MTRSSGVRRLILAVIYTIAAMIWTGGALGAPSAKLYGLDAPFSHRAPGEFYVEMAPDVNLQPYLESDDGNSNPGERVRSARQRDIDRQERALGKLALELTGPYGGHVTHASYFPSLKHRAFLLHGVSDEYVRQVLANDPRIAAIYASGKIRLLGTQGTVGNPAPWNLSRLSNGQAPPVGSFPNTYVYQNDAKGVRIYILDTGIRTSHTEFQGRAGAVVLDCVAASVAGLCGAQITNPNQQDCNGHGTEVASLVAGARYGVAKNASLAGIIVLNSGSTGSGCSGGNTSTVAMGINYVIDREMANWNGPQIINLSITSTMVALDLDNAVSRAVAAGMIVVAGAPDQRVPNGTSGLNPCSGSSNAVSPADNANVILVGATYYSPFPNKGYFYDGVPWEWDIGPCIAIYAPGYDVTAASNTSDTAVATSISGTSFATPMVAGVAAMFLQTNAHANQSTVRTVLAQAALQGQLYRGIYTADPLSANYSLPAVMSDANSNRMGAPNSLLHVPVPTGGDLAVGGTIGGVWGPSVIQKVRGALTAIYQYLFSP